MRVLYSLALAAAGSQPGDPLAAAAAGHRFEDEVADAAYTKLASLGVRPPTPPRHSLELPTVSGLTQQFDLVVVDHLTYHIIELKRRSHAEIEQVYAFVAKLLDYALAAKLQRTDNTFSGIFVSTSPRLNENIRRFALAYGVLAIAPDLVPCQVMVAEADDASLRADSLSLEARLSVALPDAILSRSRPDPRSLLREWESVAQRYGQS